MEPPEKGVRILMMGIPPVNNITLLIWGAGRVVLIPKILVISGHEGLPWAGRTEYG